MPLKEPKKTLKKNICSLSLTCIVSAGLIACNSTSTPTNSEVSQKQTVSTKAPVTGNPQLNQLGYIPTAQKIAVYQSTNQEPLTWQLYQKDKLVKTGTTVPKGFNSASGQHIHHIDFTEVIETGDSYQLTVAEHGSHAFTISPSVYKHLKYDAIKYFYHNRSGIEIKTEFTGGGNTSYAADKKWARPAGHLNKGVNKGDLDVACWPGTCDYKLDVPYGWYDAGDHGKYVVNGGISVWKLLSAYERNQHLGFSKTDFADNTFNIPESGNGVDDLLDEVRWQLEFMLAMQVPDGQALAGMVHHKMHDQGWTGLPTLPHQDDKERRLLPPTTSATLNVAANAAQAARLWQDIDPAFAIRCLDVAEKAWLAAKKTPNMPHDDKYNDGGGGYGDSNFDDEFSWAAAELFITTGQDKYKQELDLDRTETDYNWQSTALPGLISLAVVPRSYTSEQMKKAREVLTAVADKRVTVINNEGYMTPIGDNEFVWGSSNVITNILSIVALAHDFSQDPKYIQAFEKSVDYLLGKNGISISYITGYGGHAMTQPHHRFWAGALDSSLPWAPPGALSGGANSGIQDPVAQVDLKDCGKAPHTCFLDHIESWSTNEITVNWNSALFWIAAYYDDHAQKVAAQK